MCFYYQGVKAQLNIKQKAACIKTHHKPATGHLDTHTQEQ